MSLDRRHIRRHKIIQTWICLVGIFLVQAILIFHLAFQSPEIGEKTGGENKPNVGYAEKLADPVAIFTLFLVVSTVLLWRSTERLAALAARQARDTAEALRLSEINVAAAERGAQIARDTLIASNRAWIKITGNIDSNSALFFKTAYFGAETKIGWRIENVGNAPAMNISFHTTLIAGNLQVVGKAIREYRASTRNDLALGWILYPGEISPPNKVGRSTSNEELKSIFCYRECKTGISIVDLIANSFTDPASKRDWTQLYVVCIVNYTFAADMAGVHQSEFCCELISRKGPLYIDTDVNGGLQMVDQSDRFGRVAN